MWVAKTPVNNPLSKESLQNIHYCVYRNTSGDTLLKESLFVEVVGRSNYIIMGKTFKDEAQTALFKDPVRTAL